MFSVLLSVIIIVGIPLFVIRSLLKPRGGRDPNGAYVCTHCGTRGTPKDRVKGSMGMELILWLCFLLPGLLYSIWRLSSKERVCPACQQPGMIPIATPVGKKIVGEQPSEPVTKPIPDLKRPPPRKVPTRIEDMTLEERLRLEKD